MEKRIALVTGGTRGIGHAICVALKAAGYKVAATYLGNTQAAAEFTKETKIPAFKWDVADYDACVKGVKKVERDFGGVVDVLVNNAGITRDGMLHKMELDAWHKVIETNLTSCFNMCRAVVQDMRDRNFGRIVNISSVNGQAGQFGQANYSAAKAGIIGFTKALAKEGARKNVTVNAVAPGYIKTEMTDHVPRDVMEAIINQIPVRRLGKPEEVARCVAFLAADEAGFITGETLAVNGGFYME